VVIEPASLSGRIAFPVFDSEEGTYHLYSARLDGSDLQRIMSEASQPALSPGGELIAFRRWRSDDRGLEVMDAAGGRVERRTKFYEDALPSWSPDGQTMVFFSRRESDRKSRIYQVDAVRGDDWELKQGVEPIWGEYPTWHPDGSIVYRSTWPDHGLAAMNADGSDKRMILFDESATAPAVSPDGSYIALMAQSDGNWEVYRVNMDGTGLLRLTDHGANDGLPAWSPDGRTLVFVSDRGETWAVWAMTDDGQGLTQLFTLPGTPDGLVRHEREFSTRGWTEERISWGG
jgi:TolB protein